MTASPDIENLITRLARLPGLGPRSARRAALALLQAPQTRLQPLSEALETVARTVQTCPECGNLDSQAPCALCRAPDRTQDLICVVETVGDLWALERSGAYRGHYQVLGGTLSPLAGTGPEHLNLAGLRARLARGEVREVILALGATVEGATTAHWLQSYLLDSHPDVRVSQLGQGLPMGGALEVLDDGTLMAALAARRELQG
ncbi:recombination mediator RecR [Oecophyllibacter saccharovorans]|uniref:Recombination protein RecR n=1 Tax=Oecophyllibacter saccharovorans TaxID=2558360 RepID=A0A506ULW6_9PROT|nr:recombination mediator RecR [Oecophyllibacter saccharovorans]QDH15340.1 recombination protein RecR [Oecophyllibacter saccharovorans]TPW34173.1 recombination protein RecR [Oecophyllibacter saccharovorans]TPW36357.1 recombination protein RecR [Oecophyllibacter saccharovorans]